MSASFRAYIDESGDEGFRFRDEARGQGSSDWFVLSAYVTRKIYDLETVKVLDEIRKEFDIPCKKNVHWKDLKHPQKVKYSQLIAVKRGRIISICVHKPSLLEPEKFQQRYRLYFYAVRYLMERLTWLARDYHNSEKYGGDGTIEIQFSNRQGMSYDELKDYLRLLRVRKDSGSDIRIESDRYSLNAITALAPGRSMGLQLADGAAGATFNALEQDRFGNTESRYIDILNPILYRNNGLVVGYGLKTVPREVRVNLAAQNNLGWLWKLK